MRTFYAMSFVLSPFAAVAVQKNIRDIASFDHQRRPGTQPAQRPIAPQAPPQARP